MNNASSALAADDDERGKDRYGTSFCGGLGAEIPLDVHKVEDACPSTLHRAINISKRT